MTIGLPKRRRDRKCGSALLQGHSLLKRKTAIEKMVMHSERRHHNVIHIKDQVGEIPSLFKSSSLLLRTICRRQSSLQVTFRREHSTLL
jgi:hypothetical protein